MSAPERLATIKAKGGVRQALRTYIADAVGACETAAGLTGLNTPVPEEWFDTENARTLVRYMDRKNYRCCQTVFQPSRSRSIARISGSANESQERRQVELEIVTAHLHTTWDAVTFYGKEITETEDAMAARSDVYNGAVKRIVRQYAKGLAGGAIDRVDIISDNTTIDPTTDTEGLVALATVRILITQTVDIQHCTGA